jgi:hypothetical protein
VLDVYRDEFRRNPIPKLLALPQVLIAAHLGRGDTRPREMRCRR